MIGIPIGLIYSNAGEWLIHKYVLHGQGRSKKSFWSFHWHEHHKASRRHDMVDPAYEKPLGGWNAQTKEAVAIAIIALAHAPLFPVAPFFTATVWYSAVRYHHVHRRAHLDLAWAEEHLPWHVDHHLGANQDANWCVTHPWFDNWMGTRVPRDASSSARAPRRDGPTRARAQQEEPAPHWDVAV
jgi:sterol desaturase/sphingolipid hydroxylase (fatty acid hydroxylase superfamily)